MLMMGSGAGIVGSKWLISSATSAVTQENLLGGTKKTAAEGGNSLEGPIDLLLMGVDARKRWAVDDLHADTIIILHIPASHDQAYLVSIPRDTEVQVPAFAKSKYPGGTAKATEAFFHGAQNGGGWAGGAQLMAQTLKNDDRDQLRRRRDHRLQRLQGRHRRPRRRPDVRRPAGQVAPHGTSSTASRCTWPTPARPASRRTRSGTRRAAGTWRAGRPSTTPGSATA